MSKVTIAPCAESDLMEIWLYIAEDSASAADGFLDAINRKCELISQSPQMGRSRDELALPCVVFRSDDTSYFIGL